MAFVFAAIIVVCTLGLAFLRVFAAGMSDVPGAKTGAVPTLVVGLVIAGLVAGTHWLPHIPW